MTLPTRTSPVQDLLQAWQTDWYIVNAMPTVTAFPEEHGRASPVGIVDCSCLHRFGVKGPGAAHWLQEQGLPVPAQPNTWCPRPEGGLVARLGLTEFLIEQGWETAISHSPPGELAPFPPTLQTDKPWPAGVYPVLRQDLAIALLGTAVHDLLLQTCNIHFRALDLASRPVILTSMVGVAVTIIPGEQSGLPLYRIWCDGTFGPYLWRTLAEIATELGGGPIGIQAVPTC